jgi:Bax protein
MNFTEKEIIEELILRVDLIPASLALAQAANESAWGTSRFTILGNNIFGQWCYEIGCGIVPARRAAGATHEVKAFDTIQQSVEAYFLNINTHESYSYLRDLRAKMRKRDFKLDPMSLAIGLGRYSQRGDRYVDEIQRIIIQNDLRARDG